MPSTSGGRALGCGRRTLCVAAALAFACGGDAPSRPEPTVVLVVVDTLRADHMSLYGYERPTTPALEGAAAHGFVFERAFATSPWTLPSFASILTGRRPAEHGVGRWFGRDLSLGAALPAADVRVHGLTKRFAALDPGVPSLPQLLRERGFATAAIVVNPFLDPAFGLARGFDLYDYESGGDEGSRRADAMVDRALAWTAQQHGSWFVLVHAFDPHMDYDPPPETAGRFTGAANASGRHSLPVRDTPRIRSRAPLLDAESRAFVSAAYDEEIAFLDAQLARLLERLDERDPPPVVVLTADHGEELFDHGSFGHGHTAYQEQLHVPLVLFGPGVVPGRSPTPVSIADVAPTVLDALGIPAPPGMSGRSLWPVATGRDTLAPRAVHAERTGEGPERRAVIDWPHKLIETEGGARPVLFDLAADPGERNDLAPSSPAVVARLRALLSESTAPAPTASAPVELDDDTRDALRELGYLSDSDPDKHSERESEPRP